MFNLNYCSREAHTANEQAKDNPTPANTFDN